MNLFANRFFISSAHIHARCIESQINTLYGLVIWITLSGDPFFRFPVPMCSTLFSAHFSSALKKNAFVTAATPQLTVTSDRVTGASKTVLK